MALSSITTDTAAALRARGYRATSQRLVIERTLRDLARHRTAEDLLVAVRERLPGISLPTVYAALDALEQTGLVRRIAAGRGPALYDPSPVDHHHLVCRGCDSVEDLDADPDLGGMVVAADAQGFSADAAEVVVHGLCSRCRG